ncbi:hypothetical protein [Micromonospora sp. CNB394]|uniref:hypothetical protein n=1 Tax=Micromonospora sp. CNB394 TaxID=1169151 RepID=UPI003510C6A2
MRSPELRDRRRPPGRGDAGRGTGPADRAGCGSGGRPADGTGWVVLADPEGILRSDAEVAATRS